MDLDIHIFGAGSLGCAVGGILAKKHEVTLIARAPVVEAVRNKGLRITGSIRLVTHPRAATSAKGLAAPRLIVVTTKAYDTAEAAESCSKVADEHTMVLTLQNGLGNIELLRRWFGRNAYAGTTTMGAAMVHPGVVRLSGFGKTVIGSELDHRGAREIARAFADCGLRASTTYNTTGLLWEKAIVNACINPLGALLRVPNGRLTENATVSRLMASVCDECVRAALANGVRLPRRDMHSVVRRVCRNTSGNLSSMLQDVIRRRPTEIMHITGAILSCGERRGVPMPLNAALLAMVDSLERTKGLAKG